MTPIVSWEVALLGGGSRFGTIEEILSYSLPSAFRSICRVLNSPLALCLLASHHVSHHADKGLNLWTKLYTSLT